jgi:DNA-binding CsgD family transcriptional regulator
MQPGEGREAWSRARPRVTARESEVLGWVAAGKSDWAIGRLLNISGKTVNFHVENAKRKFGVATRVQAVIVAMRTGVIGP